MQTDKIFDDLRLAVPKPDKQAACHNLWILVETWRLVDKRVSTRREPGQDQRQLKRLGRAIQAYLKADSQLQVMTEGEEV